MSLLELDRLSVTLDTASGPARAVRELSFTLQRGDTLGIVGESGCGKTMTALAVMGLLPDGARAAGAARFEGRNLLDASEREWCTIRGNRIAMVFQEPMSSLNPLHRIGRQIGESIELHRHLARRQVRDESARLLGLVGIDDARARLDDYPHQLSGGQRQRVMIAMALANRPDLLIADEPTTALDVTIQKQVLDLIKRLVGELGMVLVLISHDLGVIANTVDRIVVMYGGAAVEIGPTASLFDQLAHPYTRGLLAAIPRLGSSVARDRLAAIPGSVPDLDALPSGCTFFDRCPHAVDACRTTIPAHVPLLPGHTAACLRIDMAAQPSRRGR
ncbi:MAG: ABC transporter ATP-binding protein [Gammaproteobacteria bacterium]